MTAKVPKGVAKGALRKVHGTSRRQEYSASTRRALVDVADRAVHRAAATPAPASTRSSPAPGSPRARSTTTSAASRRCSSRSSRRSRSAPPSDIHRAVRGHRDPWEKALGGLRAFLEVLQEPRYRRIVIADGPAVLGYEQLPRAGGAHDLRHRPGDRLRRCSATYELEPSMVETFSRVFFGAMSAAGAAVSTAEDPRQAGAEVEAAIAYILAGLRAMAESGAPLPGPPTSRPSPDDEDDRRRRVLRPALLRDGDVAAVLRAPARPRCDRPGPRARRPWCSA